MMAGSALHMDVEMSGCLAALCLALLVAGASVTARWRGDRRRRAAWRALAAAVGKAAAGGPEVAASLPRGTEPDAARLAGAIDEALRARAPARPASAAKEADRDRLYRLVTENASDVILQLDPEFRVVYVSPSLLAVLGFQPAHAVGKTLFDLVREEDRAEAQEVLGTVGRHRPQAELVARFNRRDGTAIWVEARCRFLIGSGAIIVVLRDIHLRKTAEDHLAETRHDLERMAREDVLTGLPNRRAFLEAAARDHAVAGESCAVLIVDLDRFKQVNDLYGHGVGDRVLVEMAQRLRQVVPPHALLARLASDEFAVLTAAGETRARLVQVAQAIIGAVCRPVRDDGVVVEIGATVGISMSPEGGQDAVALLGTADMAMYAAKRAQAGQVRVFDPELSRVMRLQAELKGDLRQAIADGEIVPFYQQIMHLPATGQAPVLTGFEALARWQHPRKGLIPPDLFIPIAEASGLIGALFDSLLDQVCADMSRWPEHVRVAMNVSGLQLRDETLPARILARLHAARIAPQRLEIEVTENALVADTALGRDILVALRDAGMSTALDDFGTGYSSIYHLRELVFDKIKIDKSFVAGVTENPQWLGYVAGIVQLGKAVGMEVAAEGVEDAAALQLLRDAGCSYAQGYLFSRPVAADAVQVRGPGRSMAAARGPH